MSDDSLRRSLAQVNSTAISIQTAASALMKHYDRSTANAVNAWRNAVVEAKNNPGSLLALVYVANEVLQTSKRNRGNQFLEAFAPILAPTLVYLAEQNVPVEKLRRVVKIWGDRRVFSLRFVQDVLGKLERFRRGGQQAPPPEWSPTPASTSPGPPTTTTTTHPSEKENDDELMVANDDDEQSQGSDSNASITDILNSHGRSNDANDDDDDDLFGGDDGDAKLDVEINLDLATAAAAASHTSSSATPTRSARSAKRRRSSGAARRPADRSMNRLLDLWKSLVENQQRCDLATHAIDRITKQMEQNQDVDVSTLVGDDLQRAARQNNSDLASLYTQRKELYHLANERHAIEQEAMSYVTWLEQALVHDTEEIRSAEAVLAQLGPYQPVHRALQQQYRADTAAAQAAAEAAAAAEQARQQKAAQQAFQAAALAKETEAKPGMVWNPTTREYQTLDTDESWRD